MAAAGSSSASGGSSSAPAQRSRGRLVSELASQSGALKPATMKIRRIIFSFALLLSLPLFAREKTDVIVMKNGDHLTCEIRGLSAGVLSVSSVMLRAPWAWSGRRWLAWRAINQSFLVVLFGNRELPAKLGAGNRPAVHSWWRHREISAE